MSSSSSLFNKNFLKNQSFSPERGIVPRYLPGKIEGDIAVVFEGGAPYTLRTGLNSLKTMMEKGYSFHKVHFSFINTIQQNINKFTTDPNYETIFKKPYAIYACEPGQNTLEVNLQSMKAGNLAKQYVIVSDPIRSRKSEQTVNVVLGKDYSCLGIICIPSKDWNLDMSEYGYLSTLNKDEATIAFAKSSWNFIARQINTEANQFKKSRELK